MVHTFNNLFIALLLDISICIPTITVINLIWDAQSIPDICQAVYLSYHLSKKSMNFKLYVPNEFEYLIIIQLKCPLSINQGCKVMRMGGTCK